MTFEAGVKVRVKTGPHMNRSGVVRFVRGPVPDGGADFVPNVAFVDLRIGDQVHGLEFMIADLALVK